MRVAFLDPALFCDAMSGVSPRTTHAIERELDQVAALFGPTPKLTIADDSYWRVLYSDLIAPLLARHRSANIHAAVRHIRSYVRSVMSTTPTRATVWSFRELFDLVPGGWSDKAVVSAAGLLAANHDVVCVVRLVENRNFKWHGQAPGAISEKTTWNLRVAKTGGAARIPCVASVRNVDVEWTCRYDDRLPALGDGASYPFCVPSDWRRPRPSGRTPVVTTWAGRNAIVDAAGRAWVRTPGSTALEHWDVQIPQEQQSAFGYHYFNVTNGWPTTRKPPGTIDHGVKPTVRRWTCPT